jgi:glycosyltransferase involved in cell wall biosynthesis
MKVTFIYAYENEEWSTPMALAREFESKGWDIEFVSIGSNRTGQYHDRDIQTWLDSKPQTDIVLFMDWGRFDSPLLDKKLVDAFWVQESGDDPQNFDRNFPKSERFHITLSPDSDSTEEYKKRGRDAYWWTHFADTRVQFPMNLQPEYVAVTTRGRGGSEFLDIVTQHGGGTIGNQNGFGPKEHTEFLNKGLMVMQKSRWGEVTRRLFEGMACGKLVLCDRLNKSKKLEELFTDGEDIVYYDEMVDCITKMNKYHEDETERNRIAENGYKKVIKNHTQKQRVEFLIKKYKEWESSKIIADDFIIT